MEQSKLKQFSLRATKNGWTASIEFDGDAFDPKSNEALVLVSKALEILIEKEPVKRRGRPKGSKNKPKLFN